MTNQQTVKGPFIVLLILGVLYLVYSVFAIILSTSKAYVVLIFPVIILSEAFVYWRIRKKIANKKIAWAHVLLLVAGFLTVTLIAILPIYFGTGFYNINSKGAQLVSLAIFIINYVFWGTFVLAHIFFVIIIVKSFSKKQELKTDEPAPGLLDEFAD